MTITFTFTYYHDDGTEEELTLKSHMEVCPTCHGTGTHVNPAIDGNGITASEMDELGDDFRENYLRGVYDVQCHECHGRNVIEVPEEDDPNFPKWVERQQEEADYRAEMEAERRAGC